MPVFVFTTSLTLQNMKSIELPKCVPTLSWNCMTWSPEGILAIAVTEFVYVLYPQNLPQLNSAMDSTNFFVRQLDPIPNAREFTFSISGEKVGSSAFFGENSIVSIFWSRSDTSKQASLPYLAVLTKDRNCFIYEAVPMFDGLNWKVRYDMFSLLAQVFVNPEAIRITQNELNRIKIGSFSWVENLKCFDDLLLIGNYRGDILLGKIINDQDRISFEIGSELPSKNFDESVWNIKTGKWAFVDNLDEYKLPIVYTLSDNSVWLVELGFSNQDNSKFKFGDPVNISAKTEAVISVFEIFNSKYGLVLLCSTCSEANIFFLDSKTSHKFQFPTYGDYRPIFSNGNSVLQILFYATNIAAEMLKKSEVDNPWLFVIEVDDVIGCQKKDIRSLHDHILVDAMSTYIRNQKVMDKSSLIFRVYATCCNSENDTVAVLYNIFDSHFMSPIRASDVTNCLKLFSTVRKEESNDLKSIINIDEWIGKKGTSDDWLIRKHVLIGDMTEDFDLSNFTIRESFENVLRECLNFEIPDFSFEDCDKKDFKQALSKNAMEFFNGQTTAGLVLKKLKLFNLLFEHPEKPYYNLNELVSPTQKREDLEFYELNLKIYQELTQQIKEKIYSLICSLVYKHIQHFNPLLLDEYDKIIKYTVQAAVNPDASINKPPDKVNFLLYDDIINLSFQIGTENSSLHQLIDTDQHSWKRCSKSLVPLLTPDVMSCSVCKTKCASSQSSDFKTSIIVPILVNSNNLCVYCDGFMHSRS